MVDNSGIQCVNFFSKDVYVVAVPAAYGPYDAEVQKKLLRAEKRKILEDLKEDEVFKAGDFYKRTKSNVHGN